MKRRAGSIELQQRGPTWDGVALKCHNYIVDLMLGALPIETCIPTMRSNSSLGNFSYIKALSMEAINLHENLDLRVDIGGAA